MAWIELAQVSDLLSGCGKVIFRDGKEIALFRVNEHFYALDDACPHAGASLAAGKIEGGFVRCRGHGLKFELATGRAKVGGVLCVASYAVRVEGMSVTADIPQ